MSKPLFLSIVAMALLTLGGCAGRDHAGTDAGLHPQGGSETGTAWQGDRSTATERSEQTARTAEEWDRLWAQAGVAAPAALPDGLMAVGLFLGPRTGTGYAVSLDPATGAGEAVVVPYHETVPGPDDPVTDQATSPFAIRLIKAQPQPVRFVLAP